MVRLVFVRHGKSIHGFDRALDSPLSETGRTQAAEGARRIAAAFPAMPVLTSPLARAVESARALAGLWSSPLAVHSQLTEIPVPGAPGIDNPTGRRSTLEALMAARYPDLPADVQEWRRHLLDFIAGVRQDSVLYTHYLTINAVVGAMRSDDRVVVCDPAHGQPIEITMDGSWPSTEKR